MTRSPASLILAAATAALLLPGTTLTSRAETSNGNDFALYFSEASEDPNEQKFLLDDAKDRPHYFRYLQIMEIEEIDKDGRKVFDITAFEPASCMDVKFLIEKPVSLSLLRKDPVSKKGDAIAVTGKVTGASWESNAITLEGTIVRHKDRLSPKMGVELLCDLDPTAVFYSYTNGPRPVNLSYQDRDLLKHRKSVLEAQGPKAWVEFLEREVGKRRQAEAAREAQKNTGN